MAAKMIDWKMATKLKIFKDRLMAWGTLANFVMIVSLSVGYKLTPMHIIILGIVCLILTVLDIKYIIPREQEYYFQRNREWLKRNK
jgi:hypothetical protein